MFALSTSATLCNVDNHRSPKIWQVFLRLKLRNMEAFHSPFDLKSTDNRKEIQYIKRKSTRPSMAFKALDRVDLKNESIIMKKQH